MKCPGPEKLALWAEGDLAEAETAFLPRHLEECPGCKSFLLELEESQRAVRELAAEDPPLADLAALRARILLETTSHKRSPSWPLGVAAVLIIAALGGPVAWKGTLGRLDGRKDALEARRAAKAPPSAVPKENAARLAAPCPRGIPRTASPGEGPQQARTTALTPEDADQLARAVVAISLARGGHGFFAPRAEPSHLIVRLATNDPDVVIYLQMDPNGG